MAITVGCVAMVTSLSFVISFYDHINILFIIGSIGIFMLTCTLTGFCCQYAADIVEKSAQFSSSYLKNMLGLNQTLRTQLKICWAFDMSIGNFKKVNKETFPNIISEIVLAKVVDLLLMLRNSGHRG